MRTYWRGRRVAFRHYDTDVGSERDSLEQVVAGADIVFCAVQEIGSDGLRRLETCCARVEKPLVPLDADLSELPDALAGWCPLGQF
jgi:hypothetical protein